MNVKLIPSLLALTLALSTSVFAQNDPMADAYFTGKNPKLTAQEKKALEDAKKWQNGVSPDGSPVAGEDGSILYVYGAQMPSIVCAVLQVCDVALQPGEIVHSIHLGDAARWKVEPATTGSGLAETIHLIIKPLDVGLETSLIVSTNKRTYHMKLRSHRKEYMPKVGFVYPEDAQAKWQKIKRQEERKRAVGTLPKTGEYLGDLDFDYSIDGDAPWKPIRVYNNGEKTIIQMPKTMAQTEAPALLVIQSGTDQQVMVNYRVQNDRYLVDVVFDKAVLIAGVGNNQNKVTVSRSNGKAFSSRQTNTVWSYEP